MLQDRTRVDNDGSQRAVWVDVEGIDIVRETLHDREGLSVGADRSDPISKNPDLRLLGQRSIGQTSRDESRIFG
jgi:hypothetical protein